MLRLSFSIDSDLECAFAIGQSNVGFGCGPIPVLHLFGYFPNDGGLTFERRKSLYAPRKGRSTNRPCSCPGVIPSG